MPEVLPPEAVLVTVMSHSAVWPCVKIPFGVFDTDRKGAGSMVMLRALELTLAVRALPETTAVFMTVVVVALLATLKLRVRVSKLLPEATNSPLVQLMV